MLTAGAAADLADLERDIDHDGKPRSLDLTGWTVSLEVKAHNGDDHPEERGRRAGRRGAAGQ